MCVFKLGYLSRVLRNYTEKACDGSLLTISCPPRTTITIQSAFYGRKGPSDPHHCPPSYQALLGYYNQQEDERLCSMSTALQKMLDECQDRRSCQVLVHSRVFGTDQCPGRSKYLIVWYKCRPNEYKSKVVCEDEKMRLSCKRGMQIAVYSAMFGRTQQGALECPTYHRRAPSVDHPERAALFFVIGICLGLFLTLFALVIQISCRTDCQPRQRPPVKKRPLDSSTTDSSDSDSDWDTTSDLSARRHRRFERTLHMNVFTSAEELERAQRLEERERIIREIWMNGQPDIPGTRSLNRYY
ncbi:hypothetical protein WMY93_016318 [Mugilogobius chulae]|uniref:SUEL-type lectin domain-containing protein n=1 Tax=Mugilogobius chulae TaxID=88201 RepID=A0AAW0NXI2_9GOBI